MENIGNVNMVGSGDNLINVDDVKNADNEQVVFKKSERMTYGALGYDGNELMAVISGYDLRIAFNMRLINSLADAEACANALAQVFYESLMEQLIAEKSEVLKPGIAGDAQKIARL